MQTIAELREEQALPVIIADSFGIVTYVNQAFVAMCGWALEEIIRQPLSVIIPSSMRTAHHLGFSRFLATGESTLLNRPLMLQVLRRDGVLLQAEHTITAEQHDGQWVFGATIKPLP